MARFSSGLRIWQHEKSRWVHDIYMMPSFAAEIAGQNMILNPISETPGRYDNECC